MPARSPGRRWTRAGPRTAFCLGARARVDDRRQLGFELGAKRLHSRRETEAVAEVFELLVELKSRPRRADLHPPSGRHRVAAVEEVVVEDLRPRAHALVGLVARALGLLAGRRRRRRCGARRRRGRRRTGGRAARRSTSGRSARRRARAGCRRARKPRCCGERQLLLERRERARALQAEDAVLGRDVVGVGDQRLVGARRRPSARPRGPRGRGRRATGAASGPAAASRECVWLAIRRSIQYSSES